MQHRIIWSSFTLALSLQPGAALAQAVVGTAVLPSAPVLAPDYRLGLSVVLPRRIGRQPRSSLDRLFVARDGIGRPGQRHSAMFGFGEVDVTAEALRGRAGIAPGSPWRGVHALDKFAAVGVTAGWAAGEKDTLSFGVAANVDKRAAPEILAGHKHVDSDAVVADCTWKHGAHLQMSLAWRADRGSSPGGINRIVELAQGAALREEGGRLTLSYAMAGAAPLRGMTLGIAARDARIAGDDLAAIGSVDRRDIQTALFVRTVF